MEDLDNFKQVRTGNAKDLEKFADLLDIAIINLQEAGQDHELGNGSLYTKLQRKLSESMLPRYHRWVFENNITESVAALRKWVIQEAEFQTIATETMHGLAGKADNPQPPQSMPRGRNQRTFFGESQNGRSTEKAPCQVCGGRHAIWRCQTFAQKSLTERWNIAKRSQFFFFFFFFFSIRFGSDQTEPKRIDPGQREHRTEPGVFQADPSDSVTEGKEQPHAEQITMVTQSSSRT